jgi:DNA (cytosine-5)-methyltransferase 1
MSNIKTFASLFSCGGGFDLGAIAAAYTPIFALDFDPKVILPYRNNIGDHIVEADVRGYDFEGIKADHLHASPSCKSSSSANKNRGETQFDIECALAICRAITQIAPRTFSLENVMQYVNMKPLDGKTNAFCKILEHLQKLGYHFSFRTLNAADYGVPQTRKRLILLASKDYYPIFPHPTHSKPTQQKTLFKLPDWVTWYEAIADLIPTLKEIQLCPWQKRAFEKEALIKTPLLFHGTTRQGSDFDELYLKQEDQPCFSIKATEYKGLPRIALIEKVGARSDRPIRTVTEKHPIPTLKALDGRTWESWVIQNGVVFLQSTVECLARWQSFPKTYQFTGVRSVDCTLIGNSVPPLLAQRIMESFR